MLSVWSYLRSNSRLLSECAKIDMFDKRVDIFNSYRHIGATRSSANRARANRVNTHVRLSPEFSALWERIEPRTTYRVEFETERLISHALTPFRAMSKIAVVVSADEV